MVDALGKDWNEVSCRGEWANLEINGDTLRFTTETAWTPCNEVLDFACQFFRHSTTIIRRKNRKHSKKCTFYTLRFGCSFAAVNTIKPQLL